MLIIDSNFTNVRATHIMLFLCGQSKHGNPFCSASTSFPSQGHCAKTLEFHSRSAVPNLRLTSNNIPGPVSLPAPPAGQSKELSINLNKNAPASPNTFCNRRLPTPESDPTEP